MKNQFVHLLLLLKRLMLLLAVFMLLRVIFMVYNKEIFPVASLSAILQIIAGGLRFDITTIIYLNSLFILLHLLPFPLRDNKVYRKTLYILFLLFNIPAVLFALIDTAYYPFNNKRITSDVFGVAGAGMRNAFHFIATYWMLALLLIVIIYVLAKGYKRSSKYAPPRRYNHLIQVMIFLFAIPLCILGARGGLQEIPITPANATDHTEVRLAPLVTNSAYTLMYSLQRPGVSEFHFFSKEETEKILQTQKIFNGDHGKSQSNVVLIILESVATEYVGYFNNGKGFTPFIDSILAHSLVFPNAFANAERSNKSMCAILGGIPSLTDDALMNTIYSTNCFQGLGTAMKTMGYYTSFYHGGINGEFKLDSYTRAAGFDHYHGQNEFNDNSYFDGNWGIYDDVFLQYIAKELDKQPQPFCSAMFTLSSHDPFNIPSALKGKFPKGYSNIIESIGYTDYSLQLFFYSIKDKPWFNNTIFIITADHTFGYGEHPVQYTNAAGKFMVPIAFYKADGSLAATDSTMAQHLDLIPSILDLTGFNGTMKCYGSSLLRHEGKKYAIQLANSIYQLEDHQYILFFDGNKTLGLYDYKKDVHLMNNLMAALPDRKLEMENYCKAILQDYHYTLIHNTLCKTAGSIPFD